MILIRGMITIIALAAVSPVVYGTKNNSNLKDCTIPLAHYRELGCKPIYSDESNCCPRKFQCPFMQRNFTSDKCYYKNETYSMGDTLGENVIYHHCIPHCICSEKYAGKAGLICAQVDCRYFPITSPDQRCIHKYKVGGCCSYNHTCNPDEISKLASCTWDNIEYKEGERFSPKNTCKHCVCTKDFDNTLNGPWCQDISCGIELFRSESISSKCAPIYMKDTGCCPIHWKCSEANDIIVRSMSDKSSDPEMKCHLGSQQFDIGDKVMGEDKCVTCSCDVPPMLSCTRAPNC